MLKKINHSFFAFAFLLVLFFSFSFVDANSEKGIMLINEQSKDITDTKDEKKVYGTFDTEITDKAYKYSDNKLSSYLPFLRLSTDRIIIDKEISRTGFNFSSKSIEVNSKTNGIQTLFSSDTIRINAPMEYGILFANGDIVINSNIEKTLILFSTGTVTISENASIGEDLICVANNIELNGTIKGSLIGSIEKASIKGKISNDMRGYFNELNIASNDNIGKNIYINTYNENLNISDQYKDAIVNIKKVEKVNEFSLSNILGMIFNAIIFALLYLVINKATKSKAFDYMLDKVKNNSTKVILSGTIILLATIPVFFILLFLSMFRLYIITIPILLVYVVSLIIIYMLNIFICGSVLYRYIKEKYLKESGTSTDVLGTICMFLVLTVLTKIPVVGSYILLALYILSVGIVFTLLFTRKSNK